jgi:hypothetical protein
MSVKLNRTLTIVLITTVLITMPWLIDTAEGGVVTDGLITHWTFDNADIDVFTVKDVVGERHGTFVGPAEIVDGGKFGEALDPIPGHVSFPNSNLPAGNDPRTLSAWVKLDVVPDACSSLFQWGELADQAISGMMVCNGGTGFFVGGNADIMSDGTVEQNVWSYIAITYDGENLRVYVNGELDKEARPGLQWGDQPRELATVLGNGGIGTIGALMNGDEAEEAFIFGVIDEVSVYDRTLSADEVKQNNDTPTQASGVVAVDTAGKLALTWGGIKLSR